MPPGSMGFHRLLSIVGKAKYSGMTLSELKRLKALEEENARLKRIVAQQALDKELLKESNAKEF